MTSDESTIREASKIVLPGVGAFGDCMKNLEESGLIPVLKESVAAGKPLLGICVGLQVLFDGSEESPGAKGLGLIHGMVKKIQAPGLKVPHMAGTPSRSASRARSSTSSKVSQRSPTSTSCTATMPCRRMRASSQPRRSTASS